MKYVALCNSCGVKHEQDFPLGMVPFSFFSDWYTKHAKHDVQFCSPQRQQKNERSVLVSGDSWEQYLDNADVKIAYAASAAVTITLASLAASSTLLSGRESTALDNGTNKYLDKLAAGNYKSAASNNQAGSIYTTIVAARDDSPSWPDSFDGTDSTEAVSKSGIFNSICKMLSAIGADNTASQTWYWGICSVAQLFGGSLPDQYVYFITHNIQTSTNAWSATEGDHSVKETPIYATVT